ncbi:unnamed protein product [Symbiodinium microadriaticum]|nr:unnamed protein product [Symbiodinium microadriaticum]
MMLWLCFCGWYSAAGAVEQCISMEDATTATMAVVAGEIEEIEEKVAIRCKRWICIVLSDLAWGLWEILLDHVNRYELEGRHEADRDSYEWQDHRWLVRPDDWNSGTIPPTVLYSPEDLSRKLDDHDDGTPFVVQVDTEEQAVDCLNMLAGALDGQATVVLTDVSAKDELKSWATSAQRTRVFGKLGAQISGRMGWLFGFGESPPAMRSKAVPEREQYLGDTWKWQETWRGVIEGYLRVFDATAATNILNASGALKQNQLRFVSIVGKPPLGYQADRVQWLKWSAPESWQDYAARDEWHLEQFHPGRTVAEANQVPNSTLTGFVSVASRVGVVVRALQLLFRCASLCQGALVARRRVLASAWKLANCERRRLARAAASVKLQHKGAKAWKRDLTQENIEPHPGPLLSHC